MGNVGMTDPLVVRPNEIGIVRVFTTDLEPEGDAAITPANVAKLLGQKLDLDAKKIEVFPARIIEGLGLPEYLEEGYGIPAEAMAAKLAVLNALTGLIILIPSSACRGQSVTLEPNAALRFVGAFEEEKAAAPARMSRRKASEGLLTPIGPPPHVRAARRHRRSWIMAVGAIIIALALVLYSFF